MPTRSREILDQIADLQNALDGFSFDQLTAAEARTLKASFNQFRSGLEDRLWSPAGTSSIQNTPEGAQQADPRLAAEAMNKILATVSHELRTPLHAISELSKTLGQSELSKEQAEQVRAIGDAADTLKHLVGELLEYTRLQSEQEPLASLEFNPGQLIEQVSYLCRSLIVSKAVTFQIDLDPQIPNRLVGDPAQFYQILMNLLGNAIKFVEQGRIELRIWPEMQPGRCLLHGEVRDTGPGISKAELPYIFDAFRKGSEPSANAQGIGLGLSIVKSSLDRLGGTISAESGLGAGTTFRFGIPFRLMTEATGTMAPAPEKRQRPLADKTILIIEDNLLNQKLLATRLKGWGCRVLTSEKAIHGIDLLSEQPVDLILMDLRMPGMDGYQASARIRNHAEPKIASIPIIAVTADLTAEDNQQVRRAGINDVVLKPFSAEEMLEKLLLHMTTQSRPAPVDLPEAAGEAGLLSLSSLWNDCMGDIEMLEEMTRLFRANLLEFLGALKTHLTLLDYEAIEACAHKIKAGLKLMEVHEWLSRVEELRGLNRTQSGVERMRQIYRELLASYPRLDQEMQQTLEQIKKDNPHG